MESTTGVGSGFDPFTAAASSEPPMVAMSKFFVSMIGFVCGRKTRARFGDRTQLFSKQKLNSRSGDAAMRVYRSEVGLYPLLVLGMSCLTRPRTET